MSTITRRLPNSNLSRELAIRQAHNKMSLVAPAGGSTHYYPKYSNEASAHKKL